MTEQPSRYAELAVQQAPVRQTFHYAVPENMDVNVGQLVEVSFRTGRSQAIVMALADSSPVPRVKPILDVIWPEPVVTPVQIALALWMSEATMSALSACLWLMLPPGVTKRGDVLYTLTDPTFSSDDRLVELLRERGPLRGAQIDHAMPRSGWRTRAAGLVRQGIVRREAMLSTPEVKARTVRTVTLAIAPQDVDKVTDKLRSQRQVAVLKFLVEQIEPVDVNQVYEQCNATSATIKHLADKSLIEIGAAERLRDPLAGREFKPIMPPTLTPGQAACWAEIHDHIVVLAANEQEQAQTFLLHGVTGSGKTEIYLRAIQAVIKQGRQAIVLVPEIALVAQTVQRFAARFPNRVNVVHSSLSDGEQYDTWRRARDGQFDVVIGARSALFTPLPDVGLIVIDEEHDDSYKQSPPLPPPYYHARDTAVAMMNVNRGTVILGSATPDVTTAFHARRGEIRLLRLPDRIQVQREQVIQQSQEYPSGLVPADAEAPSLAEAAEALDLSGPLPPVQIVDMRQELRQGNRSMFSHVLRTSLNEVLALGEKAILFLNRRGTASFVLCRDCGYVARCPRCDMPLTYHAGQSQLACHYCGYHMPQPEQCPNCQGKRIRYFGAGTASVEDAVKQEFPQARTIRWDRDTTHERGAHDEILKQFAHGDANVLVGTQMIAKGLDIPRVTLVGVILADTALGLPDYRCGERTFQLLTQVAGRAGRSWLGGRVVLQTYQPDNYAIRAASNHDYESFYSQEIEYRQTLQYPPFKRLVRFRFHAASDAQAQHDAERAATMLRERIAAEDLSATELIGPAPAFFGRVDNTYHWHIIAKTTDPRALLNEMPLKSGWSVDVDPVDIL